jgi:hypothetical protein
MSSSHESEYAQVIVITSPSESFFTGIGRISTEHKNQILEVNYSDYWVVLAFNGWRRSIGGSFAIKGIWQEGNTISILAHFDDYLEGQTRLQAISSQYEAVKIHKAYLMQTGEITFKLLDESGEERAVAIVSQ